jgi:hypothetical protein
VGAVALLAAVGLVAWKLAPRPVESLAAVDAGPAVRVAEAADAAVDDEDAGAVLAVADEPDAGASAPLDAGVRVALNAGKKSGRLNVITTHGGEPWWAQVSIDGVPRGRTPLLLDLPVGKYQLRVERAGFRTQDREIKVASGKATVLRIDLVPGRRRSRPSPRCSSSLAWLLAPRRWTPRRRWKARSWSRARSSSRWATSRPP